MKLCLAVMVTLGAVILIWSMVRLKGGVRGAWEGLRDRVDKHYEMYNVYTYYVGFLRFWSNLGFG